jgi:hypothetical protein
MPLSMRLRYWLENIYLKALSPKISRLSLKDYQLIQDPEAMGVCFEQLHQVLWQYFEALQIQGHLPDHVLFWESGRLTSHHRYLYIAHKAERGWLFEETRTGWTLARSEKNYGHDTFLRRGEPWDHVLVFQHEVAKQSVLLESSLMSGHRKISVSMYFTKIKELLIS